MSETDAEIDRVIIEGYARVPQEENPWDVVAGRDSIAEEPW